MHELLTEFDVRVAGYQVNMDRNEFSFLLCSLLVLLITGTPSLDVCTVE